MVLEYWPALLGPSSLQVFIPSHPAKQFPEEFEVCSPEVQSSKLGVHLSDTLILNCSISWSLLPLSFTLLTGPSSLMRIRSSIAPLLLGSCTSWKRKLSTHSRNLWFLLPCYVVSPKDIWMVEVLHWGPWFLNVKLSLSVCRGSKKKK